MAAARRTPRGGVFGLLLAALVMADFAFPQLKTFMMNCCDNSGAYRLKVMGKRGKGRCEPGDYRTIQAGDEVVVVGRTGGARRQPKLRRSATHHVMGARGIALHP